MPGQVRRPLHEGPAALGWGPENFGTVFGRYASGYGAVTEPHDNAHSKVIEVAATTGALGLLAWLALWASAFLVLWRAARAMEACERALAVFAAAALFGGLVQSLVLFDTAVGVLQSMLLLGFAVSPETVAVPEPRRPQMPARMAHAGAALLRRARAHAGAAVNHAIYSAADVSHLPRRDWSWREMAGGIDGFRPLANTWRWWLFNELGLHGPRILAEDGVRELNDGGHEYRAAAECGGGGPKARAAHRRVGGPSRDGEPWRHILHAYDPTRTSFVLPGPKSPGNWYYRIKACRYPGACSTAAAWPPIVVPGAGRGSTP